MHTVSLSWTASTDAVDGYNVYRGSAAGQETTKVNTALVTTTSFVDQNVPEGDDFYIVKSSLSGVESLPSNEVNAVILPAAPTGLEVTATT